MNLNIYTSFEIEHDNHKWGSANIIETIEEYNELASFFFGLGTLTLTSKGHLRKTPMQLEGAVESAMNNISYNSHEFIAVYFGKMYRFVFKPSKINQKTGEIVKDKLTGRDALRLIKDECHAKDINLEKYAVSPKEAIEIKKSIPTAWIKFDDDLDNWIKRILQTSGIPDAYHIDINSAYPAGLCENYPEFKEIYEEHYKLRKEDEEHKCILNYSIGAFQSLKLRECQAKYAKLSKAAIEWTVDKLRWFKKELEARGYIVLAYNTDGVWFTGPSEDLIHTIPGEGNGLGQWKLDHKASIIRFKSPGSYEYIEDGQYHPVVRGKTRLDHEKPRDEWVWGDIFNNPIIKYGWNKKTKQLVELEDCEERIQELD